MKDLVKIIAIAAVCIGILVIVRIVIQKREKQVPIQVDPSQTIMVIITSSQISVPSPTWESVLFELITRASYTPRINICVANCPHDRSLLQSRLVVQSVLYGFDAKLVRHAFNQIKFVGNTDSFFDYWTQSQCKEKYTCWMSIDSWVSTQRPSGVQVPSVSTSIVQNWDEELIHNIRTLPVSNAVVTCNRATTTKNITHPRFSCITLDGSIQNRVSAHEFSQVYGTCVVGNALIASTTSNMYQVLLKAKNLQTSLCTDSHRWLWSAHILRTHSIYECKTCIVAVSDRGRVQVESTISLYVDASKLPDHVRMGISDNSYETSGNHEEVVAKYGSMQTFLVIR